MSRTLHIVLVHYEQHPDREIEVLEGDSGHPQDIERIAQEKARLVELQAGESARDRPTPTWAEHQESREIDFHDV